MNDVWYNNISGFLEVKRDEAYAGNLTASVHKCFMIPNQIRSSFHSVEL
jgi:hypothetical protein